MARKIKQANKCKKCGKIISSQSKYGLCGHHSQMKRQAEMVAKRKKAGLCVQCGKTVEPIILYEAGDTMPPIIKNPIRCYSCRQMQRKVYKKMANS